MLPQELYIEIMDQLKFKDYMAFCQSAKFLNRQCRLKEKLEEEIKVPLIDYSDHQIDKLAKMVKHGSFRQDIVIAGLCIYYINEYGDLFIFSMKSEPIVHKGNYIKIVVVKSKLFGKTSLLLLDRDGKVWLFEHDPIKISPMVFEDPIVDIACHRGQLSFVAALDDTGSVYVTVIDKIKVDTEFMFIGQIEDTVKIAVGTNHILVLDEHRDVYFFSHQFVQQVPIKSNEKHISFQKILSNIVQIEICQNSSLCLDNNGNLYYFYPKSEQYIKFDIPLFI